NTSASTRARRYRRMPRAFRSVSRSDRPSERSHRMKWGALARESSRECALSVTSCESDVSPSTRRASKGGWVKTQTLPAGKNGRALFRRCALEVRARRRSFCSEYCVHEWRLRSDPGYLRDQVFARDGGICAACAMDTEVLRKEFRKLDYRARRQFLKEWRLTEGWRRSLWDADHVIPVAEGGGECDLSNMRTLCLKCHRLATTELRRRLRR